MVKKIKNSLSVKVFLWISGLLILCSLIIYGIVMFFLPQSYTVVASDRVESEIQQLTERLTQTAFVDSGQILDQFSRENQALVVLSGGEENQAFGSLVKKDGDILTTSIEISFADSTEFYTLSITAPVSAGRELIAAFVKLLPLLLLLILLISSLGAFFCSRVLARPVLEISRVSKRMANLDMTWECSVNRTDELGVLANSLNFMAKRLDAAMKELEHANQKLREDMEHITELARQRRDFFAAASHELKTPITILKGQIESMILGIGKYKDTEGVLPETLKEVENMERLVKEILTISKIEMYGLVGKTEAVSLTDVLIKVTETLSPLTKERQTTVHLQTAENVTVFGNASLLEKAIHNILSNAIRHSPKGAEVFVHLTPSALTVANTGISIPEEDLSVLFTPFYRVEKSRNKSTGGSGLGLYLVKTILELHGFLYQLNNTETGVMFTVEF
ncbi:MAG: sensor histidine kinase [Clostridiales bacterium]|nr:sensor histidine kinase [Clostridiales bacterium]